MTEDHAGDAGGAAEDDLVVLLDDAGLPCGTMAKAAVHGANTPLHSAFSVYVFGPDGKVLMTRRALTKQTWPGVWSNSCCGHVRPGESASAAARRRLGEELSLVPDELTVALPDFAYRAVSPEGVVENERCPVFAARVSSDPVPDPTEVIQWQWVEWENCVDLASSAPWLISPWAALQIPLMPAR
jgi:isopentenyl-diphosphate Delta-isomerase